MNNNGKNINLYLMDADANGRIKCTLANWTGVVFKIPRTELDKCKDREEFKYSGVYFLFGVSDDSGKNVTYIGQAGERKNGEGILNRLQEHKRNPEKDYWTEAIVFTTSNNSFGPTELCYLENAFCSLAKEANRYVVKNGNDPNPGNITEEKESEMLEFIDYAKIVMGTLGHKLFIPYVEKVDISSNDINKFDEELLYFVNKNAYGTGRRTSDGFAIYAGSSIHPIIANTCPRNVTELRNKYSDLIDENNILKEDILVSSPSAAAGFLSGTSVSGNEKWKNKAGIKLKDIESKE